MKTSRWRMASTAGLLCAAAMVSAGFLHHGWSNYDQTRTLKFTGEIVETSYENPHGMAKVRDGDKLWTVVLAPPSRMQARGLTSEMLKAAKTATIVGYPHKKIEDEMRAERIIIGDKTTELR